MRLNNGKIYVRLNKREVLRQLKYLSSLSKKQLKRETHRIITCATLYNSANRHLLGIGTATLNPKDNFNWTIGREVAINKALEHIRWKKHLKFPMWLKGEYMLGGTRYFIETIRTQNCMSANQNRRYLTDEEEAAVLE